VELEVKIHLYCLNNTFYKPLMEGGLLGFACDFGVTVAMLSPWS
jgi:hypothetical protein